MIVGTNLFSRLGALSSQTGRITDALAEATQIATTGLKIATPSDAPHLVGRIQDLNTAIADSQQYAESAATADNLLSVADSTLSDLASVLSAAHELAVQLSSETYDATLRTASAVTAESYLEEALSLVNTSVAGRALFAGTGYDGDAFDASLSYTGTAEESVMDVGEEASVTVGFDGESLGLGEVLTAISDLATALSADDLDGIQSAMTAIDEAITTLSRAQTSIGAEQITAGDFASLAESMELELTAQLSQVQEADPVEALVRLNELQTMYETALTVTASSNMGSLFDRI